MKRLRALRAGPLDEASRERRRLRIRRRGRRAYIRSVYSLPSLATLGNAVCGFGAMYVSTLDATDADTRAISGRCISRTIRSSLPHT